MATAGRPLSAMPVSARRPIRAGQLGTQASADAAALTQAVDEATSVKVAFVRLRVFRSIPFAAQGAEVSSKVHLSAGEIDTLLGAISAFVPR